MDEKKTHKVQVVEIKKGKTGGTNPLRAVTTSPPKTQLRFSLDKSKELVTRDKRD